MICLINVFTEEYHRKQIINVLKNMSMQKLIELENDRLKFIKKIKTMKKKRTSTKEGVTPETV